MRRLRWWLITKLAGTDTICLNIPSLTLGAMVEIDRPTLLRGRGFDTVITLPDHEASFLLAPNAPSFHISNLTLGRKQSNMEVACGTAVANADLIAAAPTLLAACQEALVLLRSHHEGPLTNPTWHAPQASIIAGCERCDAFVQIRAAISAARGETAAAEVGQP